MGKLEKSSQAIINKRRATKYEQEKEKLKSKCESEMFMVQIVKKRNIM